MNSNKNPKIREIKPNKNISPTAKLIFDMFDHLDCVATITKSKKSN